MQNIPCTLRITESLFSSIPLGMRTSHTTSVLLYFSVAGTCKENIVPMLLVLRSGKFSCVNRNPLTSQPITPVVALQLKVALDPSVVLTGVGVVTNSAIEILK